MTGAEIVALLTEWDVFRRADPAALGELVQLRNIVDGRHALDAAAYRAAGWDYRALGAPTRLPARAKVPAVEAAHQHVCTVGVAGGWAGAEQRSAAPKRLMCLGGSCGRAGCPGPSERRVWCSCGLGAGLRQVQLQFRFCFPTTPSLLAHLPCCLGAFGMEHSGRSIAGSATAGGCRRHQFFAHAPWSHARVQAGRAVTVVVTGSESIRAGGAWEGTPG